MKRKHAGEGHTHMWEVCGGDCTTARLARDKLTDLQKRLIRLKNSGAYVGVNGGGGYIVTAMIRF